MALTSHLLVVYRIEKDEIFFSVKRDFSGSHCEFKL